MKKVGELLLRHRGETAWLFGKGPSLDTFDMARAGSLRVCINESALCVPAPSYFFAHDEAPIQRVAAERSSPCTAILETSRARFAEKCGWGKENIFVYEKRRLDQKLLSMPPQALAATHALYGNSGTVHSAIHFCHLVGVVEVVMVGFDGGGGYASCLELPSGGAEHERIRRDSETLLRELELPYRFS